MNVLSPAVPPRPRPAGTDQGIVHTHIYIPTAHTLGAWKSERFLTLLTPPGNGNTSRPGNVETADVPSPAWHRACGAMSVTGCDGNGHLAPLAEAGLCS